MERDGYESFSQQVGLQAGQSAEVQATLRAEVIGGDIAKLPEVNPEITKEFKKEFEKAIRFGYPARSLSERFGLFGGSNKPTYAIILRDGIPATSNWGKRARSDKTIPIRQWFHELGTVVPSRYHGREDC